MNADKSCKHTAYRISKSRFKKNGESFSPWEYRAVSTTPDHHAGTNPAQGITNRHSNLDSLARELSTFPNSDSARYLPENDGGVTLSASGKGTLAQRGTVADDELGQLAVLILDYQAKLRQEKIS
jgi:hypothetical protein